MQKQIILDVTNLSPGQQCDVIRALHKCLRESAQIITEDLQYYSPGEAKDDMTKWRDAARKLASEISEQAKEQKIIYY